MRNITQRAVTYSLLAYIRDKEDFIEGPVDVFCPNHKKGSFKIE